MKTTDCLIQQTSCGRIAGIPVCAKCGVNEHMRYTTEEAVTLAKAQASAIYWQNEAAEVTRRCAVAEAERQELERLKSEEAKLQAEKDRQEMAQQRKAQVERRLAEDEKKKAKLSKLFQDHPKAPKMVVLPSGIYRMGSADNDPSGFSDERPQHKVLIAYKLAIGLYPVTFEEWDACVADGGTSHKPEDCGWGRGQRPVINVSWDDAQAYIAWLNKKLGLATTNPSRYRLPSEAEWEYACRAGSQTKWCFGDDEDQLYAYAWYNKNSGGKTQPVGQNRGNAFGLYDLHGNVWEWVQDSFGYGYEGAPSNGTAWEGRKVEDDSFFGKLLGLKRDVFRVIRGGSWFFNARLSRAASRLSSSPGDRIKIVGFRLARTLP